MKTKITFTALLIAAIPLFAADSLSTKIKNPYNNLRAMGMGNAFTAVADDYSLIFYNPAGFANKKNNEIQMSLIGAGVSAKTTTLMKDITDASNTTGTDEEKAEAISNVLANYYGESLGGKFQMLEFFWVRKGFGYAVLPMDLTLDMTINRQLGPSIDLNITGDTTLALGFGTEIFKNIDAGITAKYLHRVAVEQSVSALELATNSNVLSSERFKEGTVFDFDVGFLWKPNWFNTKTVKVETIAPEETKTPEPTPAPVEEVKAVEDSKTETAEKDADTKKDEERAPQAEGDATEVKVVENADKAPTGSDEKPSEGPAAEVAATEEKKSEDVKPEENKPAETKVEEQVVDTGEENYPLVFGLTVHNVIGGQFSLSKMVNKDATEVPTKLYRVVDVGSQYKIYEGEDLTIRYMLDFRNLLHPEITFNKATHTGFEFDYSPSGWFKTQFRVGLNQMYYTAGVTCLFGIFQGDIATYGEEVGTKSTKLENRVYALKLAMNF